MNGRWILGSFIFRVNMILGGKQTTIFPFFPFLSFSVFFFFTKGVLRFFPFLFSIWRPMFLLGVVVDGWVGFFFVKYLFF